MPNDARAATPIWRRVKGWGFVIALGLSAIAGAMAFNYVNKGSLNSQSTQTSNTQDGHAAYLKAISETNAALRRARLQDFLRIYPTDSRSQAAQTQLEVLNAYETRDWNYITKIAYENSLSHTERLAALEDYNQRWGGDLLGGRAKDIEQLRANIADLPDRLPKPDRRLESSQSPIPQTIISDRLLGEPPRAIVRTIPKPPVFRPAPRVVGPKDIIVEAKVTRNVTPRYPRKALRRNINALVVLRLSVDAKGKVQMTELVEVNARNYQKDFIKAAERAARRTRFKPKTVNGKAVPDSSIIKRYRFRG